MATRSSIRLGRVKSIQVYVNVTWLVVFALLVYWLKTGYVAEAAPNLSAQLGWVASVAGGLVIFASVLVHELAHSMVATRNGLVINKITLFIFGGVAHMQSEPASPGVELKMAIAGPLASVAIAGIFGALRFAVLAADPQTVPALVCEYGTLANLVLAGFNMAPGYPLDGGRVLRAILWKASGDYVRSTVVAAGLGRGVGLAMVFVGGMASTAYDSPGFLWLALVGTFLERLAFVSAQRARFTRRRPGWQGPMSEGAAAPVPYHSDWTGHGGWHSDGV